MYDVAIIGGGPAGLAVSKCLKDNGLSNVILEKEDRLGASWHHHYDRLHLHTARARSHLPGKPLPRHWPQYVPRAQFVEYLTAYAEELAPEARLGCTVQNVRRDGDGWTVTHSSGEERARAVVMATGFAQQPVLPDWPGSDDFPGPMIHTQAYRNAHDLPGDRVLVVGFGNSGGEIAIELVEAGRQVDIAVRSPVNLLPKELFGIPIGNFEIAQKLLGARLADMVNAPILRMVLGDYEQYGLRKSSVGPIEDVQKNGRVPLIDLGTLQLMREGRLRVRPGLSGFDGNRITFEDGGHGTYDAVLLATGYHVDLRPILGDLAADLDADGRPNRSGCEIAPGMWAISYHAVSNGQLRAITQQAPVIADEIASGLS